MCVLKLTHGLSIFGPFTERLTLRLTLTEAEGSVWCGEIDENEVISQGVVVQLG